MNEEPCRNMQSSLPWVRSCNKILRSLLLPKFAGHDVVVATDLSGHHKRSQYEVFGIVAADLDASASWFHRRAHLRKHLLSDGRRMSFKGLKDNVRANALIPFLDAADELKGVCLCVAVHKSIKSLCLPPDTLNQLTVSNELQGAWTFPSFERMCRMTHFVSILLGRLCSTGQNITWISDEDEMFESPMKSKDTRRLLSTFSSLYMDFPLGNLGIGTTKLDEGDRVEEDLSAVPDLAAGAVCESLNMLLREFGPVCHPSMARVVSGRLSSKTELLLSWMSDNTQPLKRAIILFDKSSDDRTFVTLFSCQGDTLSAL